MAQNSSLWCPQLQAPGQSRVCYHVLVAFKLVALTAPGLVQHHHCTPTRFDNACDHPRARRGLGLLLFLEIRIILRNRWLFIAPAVGVRGVRGSEPFRRNTCQGQDSYVRNEVDLIVIQVKI